MTCPLSKDYDLDARCANHMNSPRHALTTVRPLDITQDLIDMEPLPSLLQLSKTFGTNPLPSQCGRNLRPFSQYDPNRGTIYRPVATHIFPGYYVSGPFCEKQRLSSRPNKLLSIESLHHWWSCLRKLTVFGPTE